MKKMLTLSIIMMFVMTTVVSAASWSTTNDSWADLPRTVYDTGVFGDQYTFWDKLTNLGQFDFLVGDQYAVGAAGFSYADSTWHDLGNVKNGYYADPTSFTGYRTTAPSSDYRTSGSYYEYTMGASCRVGEYVAVLYANSYYTSPNKWAFAAFYYKAFTSDVIPARSYWLKDLTGTVSYRCYQADVLTVEYMCLSGSIYENNDKITTCPSNTCAIAKFTADTQYTNTEIQDLLCKDVVIPPKPPVMITCYSCQGTQVVTESVESCSSGFSTTPPTTCSNNVNCYKCQSGDIKMYLAEDNCPANLVRDPATLSCEENKIITFLKELFDFRNNPVQASLVAVALLLFVFTMVKVSTKGKSNVVKL